MHDQVFLIGAVVAVAVLISRAVAPRLKLPDAVLLVLFGVAASHIPGLPAVGLSPDLVFLLLLPPLLYHAAFFSAPRETKENLASIMGLAIGATIATTAAVALVARLLIPDLGWAPAIALGAAVAPTDAVAATAVLQKLGAPARIVTILEGESLINDAAALTIFALALEAASSGFALGHGVLRFVVYVGGGVVYGLLVGFLIALLRRWVRDPNTQILMSLVTPYAAFVPAERLHASGVLATVTAAGYLGIRGHGLLQPASRLQAAAFWSVLTFLLESLLFVLLGLQLRMILDGVRHHYPVSTLAFDAAVVLAVVIGVRLAWQALVPSVAASAFRLRTGLSALSPRQRFVVGWCGLRGAISLAIALSIPYTAAGVPFPHRPLLLFLTAVVVCVTLIGGATTLPSLLRRLGVAASDRERSEGIRARLYTTEAALRRLEEAVTDGAVDEDTARAFRQLFELHLDRLHAQMGESGTDPKVPDTRELRVELVRSQRSALHRLYEEGRIGADTLREIGRELDADEARFGRRPGIG